MRFYLKGSFFAIAIFFKINPIRPPPHATRCAACESEPNHLQLFLYFLITLFTVHFIFLLHSRSHNSSRTGFLSSSSRSALWPLLARFRAFWPAWLPLGASSDLSRLSVVPPAVSAAHPSGPCLSQFPGAEARFFLSLTPA